jgi:hypothetical protein
MTLSEGFLPTEALDIYIDSCRHLPDNASYTKVFVRVTGTDFVDIVKPHVTLASLEDEKSSLRN